MKRLKLSQLGQAVCLSIGDKRMIRFWMTDEDALHLASRLMAYASGQQVGIETVLLEIEIAE